MSTFTAVPPPPDAVTSYAIGGLAVAVAVAVVWIWRRYAPASAGRAALVLAGWMAGTGGLAASGALARFDLVPPPMALLMPAVFVLAAAVGFSPAGGALAAAVPLTILVGLQAFRLPLELAMHRAASLGIMPPELSYAGYNFDILTGAGALGLAAAMRAGLSVPPAIVWIWNLWGLGCLLVITAVAVATSPMVRAFGDDPRHVNTWVLHVPYVWVPAVLVVVALAGHLVVTRALVGARRA